MGDEEEKKSRVQMRRDREVPVEQPTSVQVNDGGDYLAYLNNVGVAPENNLPKPKATPMGVGGDGRYANTDVNTDANTGTAALNNLFGDSWALTPEQEQARLRRMHTSSMIGNLGNVMSAFANLYYAGKGAPSQKVPDAVVPDYMKFADRVSQARKNVAAQKLALEKLKNDKENKSLELRMKQLEMDMKRPVYEAQARSYDALVLQRQAAAAYNEARIAIQQGNYELAQKKLEEAERHNRAVEAIQGMNANTNATRLGWQMQPEYTETTVDKSDYNKETRTVTKGRGQRGSGGGSSASSQGGKNNQATNTTTRGSLLPK